MRKSSVKKLEEVNEMLQSKLGFYMESHNRFYSDHDLRLEYATKIEAIEEVLIEFDKIVGTK